MGRPTQRLSVKKVENLKKAGYYLDGAGLYLQVSSKGTKSWLFLYMLNLRSREMGLGSLNAVSLAEARIKAANCRRLLAEKIDPIQARAEEHRVAVLDAAKSKTFEFCVEGFIKAHKAEWKNAKSEQAWRNTLMTYCGPVFGAMPVKNIDTALVIRALEPIWQEKHETATRIRARLVRVLDWAKVRGYRTGDNPARWEGHLKEVLAHLPKTARVKHHPALPYKDITAFMGALRARNGSAARALEFTVLTAARTAMTRFATADEFDEDLTVWTVPGVRMKGRRGVPPDHRIPLSPAAAAIIRERLKNMMSLYIFASDDDPAKPLHENSMLLVANELGYAGVATPHGFRSTFRDWAEEMTNYHPNIAEMALAHTIKNQAEAAYRRGDVFDKRRRQMNEWAKYCTKPAAKGDVVPINRRSQATA